VNDASNSERPSAASWVMVAVAWTLVGVPLLWGIFQTIEKARPLFT
jgi:hypothetical protein